jgi:hypothetical protein
MSCTLISLHTENDSQLQFKARTGKKQGKSAEIKEKPGIVDKEKGYGLEAFEHGIQVPALIAHDLALPV